MRNVPDKDAVATEREPLQSQSACCTTLSYEIVADITVYNAAVDIYESYVEQGASPTAIDNAYHVVIYTEGRIDAMEGVYSSAC